MLSAIYNNDKLFLKISASILFLSVLLFVYTGAYPVLFLPVAWLYFILLAKNWKAAFWAFLFLIPLSVQLSISGNDLTLCIPDEPMMIAFLGLSILLIAFEPSYLKGWWYLSPIVIIVSLQFLWMIISAFYSTVPLLSFKYILSKCWLLAAGFIMPVLVFRKKEDITRGFTVLLAATLITMVAVAFRHSSGNFSFAGIDSAVRIVYANHVEYSTFIAMFFPFVFVACLWLRDRNKKLARFMFAIACFFIIMVFLSYARAAVLALLFAFVIYFAIRKKIAHWVLPAIYGLVTLILFFAIRNERYLNLRPNYEQTYMNWDFSEHMVATFKGRDESSMERLYRWIAAIRMSQVRPVFGYGPHGFYYNYKDYTLRSFRTYASVNVEHSTTHNYFLYMLAEQGFPAMALYALLNLVIFVHAQRIYHRLKDRFYKLCTMGIAMLFAVSFVTNFFSELIETHKVGTLFFLSLALLVIMNKKSREDQNALV